LSRRRGSVSRQLVLSAISLRRALDWSWIETACARAAAASASARRARSLQLPPASADVRLAPVPLLGHPHVRLDPRLGVAEQLERVVVDDLEVGDHDLASGGADLQAESKS
jgi:hypothetical protein